jgi:RNA polymerase sigma factor (sigma-70 family)
MLNTHEMLTSELLQRMTRVAERFVSRTDAMDIVQDTAERLMACDFDPSKGSFSSYALRATSNAARNWRKAARNNGHDSRERTGKQGEAGEHKVRDLVDTMPGADGRHDVERTALTQSLVEMLDVLDEDERRFIMAINEGMTQTEAGALVGWSPATATRRRKAIAAKLAHLR